MIERLEQWSVSAHRLAEPAYSGTADNHLEVNFPCDQTCSFLLPSPLVIVVD